MGGRPLALLRATPLRTRCGTTKSWVPGSHSTGMLRRGGRGRVWAFVRATAHQAAATAVEAARVRAVEARRGEATHVFLTASKIIWPREVTPSPRYLRSSSPCSARVWRAVRCGGGLPGYRIERRLVWGVGRRRAQRGRSTAISTFATARS